MGKIKKEKLKLINRAINDIGFCVFTNPPQKPRGYKFEIEIWNSAIGNAMELLIKIRNEIEKE